MRNPTFANDQVRMSSIFEQNHRESIANHEATTDEFLKALWARQMIFWARLVREFGA